MRSKNLLSTFRPLMNQRGFPIIELYIVIAILIILTIIGPGGFAWGSYKAGGVAIFWDSLTMRQQLGYAISTGLVLFPFVTAIFFSVKEMFDKDEK